MQTKIPTPIFNLEAPTAKPDNLSPEATVAISQLLDLGFIYSHDISVKNILGRPSHLGSRIIAYLNVNHDSYALVSDLFHDRFSVLFTNYYATGDRLVTTNQAGKLSPGSDTPITPMAELHLWTTGSLSLDAQWRKHQQLAESKFPQQHALLLKAEQHLIVEQGFYLHYLKFLEDNNLLQQFSNKTAKSRKRTYIGKKSTAKTPTKSMPVKTHPQTKRIKLPTLRLPTVPKSVMAASLLMSLSLYLTIPVALRMASDETTPVASSGTTVTPSPVRAGILENTATNQAIASALAQQKNDATQTQLLNEIAPAKQASLSATLVAEPPEQQDDPGQVTQTTAEAIAVSEEGATAARLQEPIVVASAKDEMWHIAVENAEFYLLSDDGDPTPWIRSAKRIAAAFADNDPRLARTYFLSALVESDYRVAEQHYQRALKIQTAALGLYHAETAQTLEALAWLAEHDKDALDEAISHQQVAVNIYTELFGIESEDTVAAIWKLRYFDDRLAGSALKSDEKRRLLPALAKFDR